MKAVFRIANRIRSAAPIPRDFLPIKGLDHLGLVYQQRIIESAEDFNATWAAVNDPRFPSRGCTFLPYILTPEDEAKMTAPAVVEPVVEPVQEESPPVQEETPAPAEEQPAEPEAPAFILDGKNIMLGNERVAKLSGDDKQLRVVAAFAGLRPQIEAWLQTLTPSDQ